VRKSASTMLVAMLVAMLALAGCSAPPEPTGPSPDDIAAQFNLTDRAWLEFMIPMDTQLLPALDLAATHSLDPRLRALAADFAVSVHSELDQLRELGGMAVLPADNPHTGMKMLGLVDADTLTSLRQSPPATFDPALLGVVRDNIGQAVSLADSERQAGAHERTTALAAAVASLRETERARLATITGPAS
jgi:hypothetical protein